MPAGRRLTVVLVLGGLALAAWTVAVLWYLFAASDRADAASVIQAISAVVVPAAGLALWLWQRYGARPCITQGDRLDRAADAGTFLNMAVQTAQRDPRAYPGGGTFDITAVHEAPLLQFGAGPHFCLGAALARAELGEALPILTRRFGPPVIAGEVTWRPALGIHGPNELPLALAPPV